MHKNNRLTPLLAQHIHKANAEAHLLSPESPDVAISSFNSFRNSPISAHETRRLVAHHPPASIQQAQRGGNEFGSMDSIARTTGMESGDELFAKALSPRSPDIPRSPFSFSFKDTIPYFATKRAWKRRQYTFLCNNGPPGIPNYSFLFFFQSSRDPSSSLWASCFLISRQKCLLAMTKEPATLPPVWFRFSVSPVEVTAYIECTSLINQPLTTATPGYQERRQETIFSQFHRGAGESGISPGSTKMVI